MANSVNIALDAAISAYHGTDAWRTTWLESSIAQERERMARAVEAYIRAAPPLAELCHPERDCQCPTGCPTPNICGKSIACAASDWVLKVFRPLPVEEANALRDYLDG